VNTRPKGQRSCGIVARWPTHRTQLDLHTGRVKLPLFDMKWHPELLPLPPSELQHAAGVDEDAALVVGVSHDLAFLGRWRACNTILNGVKGS